MPLTIGDRIGPFDGGVDTNLIQRLAAATLDSSPLTRDGLAVPVTAIVTQIWQAQEAGRQALVSEAIQSSATGGVHGEHDIVLHRPIRPGEPLQTWVQGVGARPAGRNSLVTLCYSTYDAQGSLVAEQWWITAYFNVSCQPVGTAPPDHRLDDRARQQAPAARYLLTTDTEMPRRYAEVSGDWSPHHFEMDAATQSGVDRPFLHGLCTMAICAQGMVAELADGDPDRVRRIAVRFAAPAFPGEQITVTAVQTSALTYGFDATSAGAAVITNGLVELRS